MTSNKQANPFSGQAWDTIAKTSAVQPTPDGSGLMKKNFRGKKASWNTGNNNNNNNNGGNGNSEWTQVWKTASAQNLEKELTERRLAQVSKHPAAWVRFSGDSAVPKVSKVGHVGSNDGTNNSTSGSNPFFAPDPAKQTPTKEQGVGGADMLDFLEAMFSGTPLPETHNVTQTVTQTDRQTNSNADNSYNSNADRQTDRVTNIVSQDSCSVSAKQHVLSKDHTSLYFDDVQGFFDPEDFANLSPDTYIFPGSVCMGIHRFGSVEPSLEQIERAMVAEKFTGEGPGGRVQSVSVSGLVFQVRIREECAPSIRQLTDKTHGLQPEALNGGCVVCTSQATTLIIPHSAYGLPEGFGTYDDDADAAVHPGARVLFEGRSVSDVSATLRPDGALCISFGPLT